MPKKGTPQYEIWKQKFQQKIQQKRASFEAKSRKQVFENQKTVSSLKKKVKENLIDEQDLLMLMFLADVDPNTLSVAALQAIKDKFKIEDEELGYVVSFFKTLAKDQLRLRLIGVYNFYKINKAPDTWPSDLCRKHTPELFKEKYGYRLDVISKVKDL